MTPDERSFIQTATRFASHAGVTLAEAMSAMFASITAPLPEPPDGGNVQRRPVTQQEQTVIFAMTLDDETDNVNRALADLTPNEAYFLAERASRLYVLASARAEDSE